MLETLTIAFDLGVLGGLRPSRGQVGCPTVRSVHCDRYYRFKHSCAFIPAKFRDSTDGPTGLARPRHDGTGGWVRAQ